MFFSISGFSSIKLMCMYQKYFDMLLFRLLAERLQRAEHEVAASKANIQKVMKEKMEAEKSVTMLRIDYFHIILA